jgi:hypothetical protein
LPERLLQATLLQLLHSLRSDPGLVERIEFDCCFAAASDRYLELSAARLNLASRWTILA